MARTAESILDYRAKKLKREKGIIARPSKPTKSKPCLRCLQYRDIETGYYKIKGNPRNVCKRCMIKATIKLQKAAPISEKKKRLHE